MTLNLYSRRNKLYVRFLVVFIIIYTFGQYIVGSENQLTLSQQTLRIWTATNTRERKIEEAPDETTAQRNTTKNTSENNGNMVMETPRVPYHVIYSEKTMQNELKAIHEKGEQMINQVHDACQQRLPQCLIIGNYKSGTQELLEFMYMHPRIRIYREPLFELNFFGGKRYSDGLDWYQKQMPCSYSGQITVEKSPSYFQEPDSPAQIHAMNPEMKLIALVREPIARSLAHFSYSKHIAVKYKYKFENCAIDPNTGNITRDCFFIKHSIYDEGMDRYLSLFNRSQIMVIDSADFKSDPFKILYDIETFLEIEHVIDGNQFVFVKEKGFHCVRSARESNLVVCYDKKRGRPDGEKDSDNRINQNTMKKLISFFKPRNENFFQQVGQNFNWQYNKM